MISQRRVNELDNFLTHNQHNRMVSPRNAAFNNLTNNYYSNQYQDHPKIQRNISPSAASNPTRKPMISPVRSPRNMPTPAVPPQKLRTKQDTDRTTRQYFCSNENHRNKKAEYLIHIEDEDMYYCGICATQAASQGFTVSRIGTVLQGPPVRRQKVVPHYPNYINNKRYHELTQLMSEIISLENQFKGKDPSSVREHYSQQQKMLNDFYDEQIEIIERMRRDHLNDLKAEEEESRRECEVRFNCLKDLMSDLNSAWDDIEETIQDIVELVQEGQYQRAMQTYKSKVLSFQQMVQQMNDLSTNFTAYEVRSLSFKIKAFQNKLLELWTEDSLQEQPTRKRIPDKIVKAGTLQLPTSVKITQGNPLKNMHENLPRPSNQSAFDRQDRQEPFRNLFPEDDGEERLPEASPQFKAF